MSEVSVATATPNHNPNPFIHAMKTESKLLASELKKSRGLIEQTWAQNGRESHTTEIKIDGAGPMRLRWLTDETAIKMTIIVESVKGAGRNAQSTKDSFLIVTRDFRDGVVNVLFSTSPGYKIVGTMVRDFGLVSDLRKNAKIDDDTWIRMIAAIARAFGT